MNFEEEIKRLKYLVTSIVSILEEKNITTSREVIRLSIIGGKAVEEDLKDE